MRSLSIAGFLMVITALFLMGFSPIDAQAVPFTIDDDYIGADPTHDSYDRKDVIGEESLFGVSKMEVSYAGSLMYVDIYTQYLDNIGEYKTELGDLFISTDGWNPSGSSETGYLTDSSATGEDWEYVLHMDDYLPSVTTTSGKIGLYATTDGSIINSYAPSGYIYREGQEVQFNPNDGISALVTGKWTIEKGAFTDDYLRFEIDWRHLAGISTDLGFHWTMTCGNDVIEGSAPAPTPEPATIFLLGLGLAGLAGYRRFKG